jgi:hypothetical protein
MNATSVIHKWYSSLSYYYRLIITFVDEFKNRNYFQHSSNRSSNNTVCIRSVSSKPTGTSISIRRLWWLPSFRLLPPPILLPSTLLLPPPILLPSTLLLPPPILLPSTLLLPPTLLLRQLRQKPKDKPSKLFFYF